MKVIERNALLIEAHHCNVLDDFLVALRLCPLITGIKNMRYGPTACDTPYVEYTVKVPLPGAWNDVTVRVELGDYLLWNEGGVWSKEYNDFHKQYMECNSKESGGKE